jgi:hypothetical protein
VTRDPLTFRVDLRFGQLLLLLLASSDLLGLTGQGGEGADLDGAIWGHGPDLQFPAYGLNEVAQSAHEHVGSVLDLRDLGLLNIEASSQDVLGEGKGPAQFGLGYLLSLALLNALAGLWDEDLGERREGARRSLDWDCRVLGCSS